MLVQHSLTESQSTENNVKDKTDRDSETAHFEGNVDLYMSISICVCISVMCGCSKERTMIRDKNSL